MPEQLERLAKLIADNFSATEVAYLRDYMDEFSIYDTCVRALEIKSKEHNDAI